MEVCLSALCVLLVVSVCLGVGLGVFLGRDKSTNLGRVELKGGTHVKGFREPEEEKERIEMILTHCLSQKGM